MKLYKIIGVAFGICLIMQLAVIYKLAHEKIANLPPILKETIWLPDKQFYKPGDRIIFTHYPFTDKESCFIYMSESFESVDGSTILPGNFFGRYYEKDHRYKLKSVRQLPSILLPGKYILVG